MDGYQISKLMKRRFCEMFFCANTIWQFWIRDSFNKGPFKKFAYLGDSFVGQARVKLRQGFQDCSNSNKGKSPNGGMLIGAQIYLATISWRNFKVAKSGNVPRPDAIKKFCVELRWSCCKENFIMKCQVKNFGVAESEKNHCNHTLCMVTMIFFLVLDWD